MDNTNTGMPANTRSKATAGTPETPGKPSKHNTSDIRVPATTARPARMKILGFEGTQGTERIAAPFNIFLQTGKKTMSEKLAQQGLQQ
jgi:hypothetical protein